MKLQHMQKNVFYTPQTPWVPGKSPPSFIPIHTKTDAKIRERKNDGEKEEREGGDET